MMDFFDEHKIVAAGLTACTAATMVRVAFGDLIVAAYEVYIKYKSEKAKLNAITDKPSE